MCQAGASKKHRSFFMVVGQLNDCKWVFNLPGFLPWCNVLVHLEVKTSHFWACVQDYGPQSSAQLLVCQAGTCSWCRSFFTVIGQLNDCKGVFNEPCFLPWCNVVVHLGGGLSSFPACFQYDDP